MAAGELVSLVQQGNAIAHSVNRAGTFLEDVPVHNCEYRLSFTLAAHTISEITNFDGFSQGSLDVGSTSFTMSGYPEDLYNGALAGAGTCPDGIYTYVRTMWLRGFTFGGVKVWFLEETDIHESLSNTLLHSAWVATRRTALRNTPKTGTGSNKGDLVFTAVSFADYLAWWPDHPEGAIWRTTPDSAYGPLCDWPFPGDLASNRASHMYAVRPAPTCDVEIIAQ